jgi:hypothetical protein
LRRENGDLVIAFEEILASEPEMTILENEATSENERREMQMSMLVAKKLEVMNNKQWRFKFGHRSVEVRKQVDRVVKVMLVAKDGISSGASANPHAALAWAGVCTLLQVRETPNVFFFFFFFF